MKVIPFFIIFVETINIMKNIFLLPTDKPSRLAFDTDENFYLLCEEPVFFEHQELVENRSIYITSDEEIKVGDHILDIVNGEVMISKGKMLNNPYVKKIIITTDPKLIADGVQSIDDEFLEWFVKNSSCEFVEVKKIKLCIQTGSPCGMQCFSEETCNENIIYKIIIPQEEPNLENLESISSTDLSPELKQLVNDNWDYLIGADDVKNEIRYSEDEVRELLIKGLTHNDDKLCGSLVTVQKEIRTANFNVWFEENKKK
jgi:hypothetical protein